MRVDTVIFGGGAAGLWLLDELVRRDHSVVLLEAAALGTGQTIAAQGIIHGGLKYTLQGLLTPSATGIREMPLIWRDCLESRAFPDLGRTRLRSQHCCLWRTDSLRSRLGLIGARIGLRVAPEAMSEQERPEVLRDCPGTVQRLPEQVIAVDSFLAALAEPHAERIGRIDTQDGLDLLTAGPGHIQSIRLRQQLSRTTCDLEPENVVFAAGAGNAELRRRAGLSPQAMQRRPLQMVMVRGEHLPELNGHCVDGARTRVTITSDVDAAGRRVWQLGGQLAEDGVGQSAEELIQHARRELLEVLPGLDPTGLEWATYRVDRAEGAMEGGRRPETVQILEEGNVWTAWPTKLALAPELARQLGERLETRRAEEGTSPANSPLPADWPRPEVAALPWDACTDWQRFETTSGELRPAA